MTSIYILYIYISIEIFNYICSCTQYKDNANYRLYKVFVKKSFKGGCYIHYRKMAAKHHVHAG